MPGTFPANIQDQLRAPGGPAAPGLAQNYFQQKHCTCPCQECQLFPQGWAKGFSLKSCFHSSKTRLVTHTKGCLVLGTNPSGRQGICSPSRCPCSGWLPVSWEKTSAFGEECRRERFLQEVLTREGLWATNQTTELLMLQRLWRSLSAAINQQQHRGHH